MVSRRGPVMLMLLALMAACTSGPSPAMEARSNTRVTAVDSGFLTATIVPPIPPMPSPTLVGPLAQVIAWLDMGEGSAAFDAMIYGQEVSSGATYKAFMSVGDHHAEAVRRKTPETLFVQAPGRYVFYARLTYVPELYHWGYTGTNGKHIADGYLLPSPRVFRLSARFTF